MELAGHERKLIWDYIFFHYHSPLNTNPDDYRKFNYLMFRAIKLNFLYTASISVGSYYLLIGTKNSLLRGISTPGYIALGLTIYSSLQFYLRMKEIVYSKEALQCAMLYKEEVGNYNSHYQRMFGNK